MNETSAHNLTLTRDHLTVDPANTITDVIGAAVISFTWASICSLVVTTIWHSDHATLHTFGSGVYWLSMALYVSLTVIAIVTSALCFLTLWVSLEIVRKRIEAIPSLIAGIPLAMLNRFLSHSWLLVVVTAVASLILPAAMASGFITH